MSSRSKKSDEYTEFENVLKKVLSVPRSELQRREQEYQEQRKNEKRPKTSDASRASDDND